MMDVHPMDDVQHDYAERVQEVTEPVAVAVVSAQPLRVQRHPSREFTTGSVTVVPGANPVQIIGANPFRDTLFVKNDGAAKVYVGAAPDTLTPGGGFPLDPGERLPMTTRHAVYVCAATDAAQPVAVAFLAEHVDG